VVRISFGAGSVSKYGPDDVFRHPDEGQDPLGATLMVWRRDEAAHRDAAGAAWNGS
jgi:hypothetical protein